MLEAWRCMQRMEFFKRWFSKRERAEAFSVAFPEFVKVTLVVCSKQCGTVDRSINGETVICENCGKIMRQTAFERTYRIRGNALRPRRFERYPDSEYLDPKKLCFDFEKEESVAYAVCNHGCGFAALISDGGSQICPRCGGILFRECVGNYEK